MATADLSHQPGSDSLGQPTVAKPGVRATPRSFTQRLELARLTLMVRYVPWSASANVLIAIVTAFMLAGNTQSMLLRAWLGMVCLSCAIRLVLGLLSRKYVVHDQPGLSGSPIYLSVEQVAVIHRWGYWYTVAALLVGLAWACLPLIVPTGPFDLVVGLIAGGVMISGYIVYGASQRIYWFYALPIFITQALSFVVKPVPNKSAILLVWLMYGLVVLIVQRIYVSTFRSNLIRRIEQEMVAAERRSLIETMTLGVLVTNQRIITDCNSAFLEMFGYEREQVIGYSTYILMASDQDWANADQVYQRLLTTGSLTIRGQRLRADGRVLDMEIKVGLVDAANPESSMVWVYEDITERLRLERQLIANEERTRLAIDALQSGLWDYDVSGNHLFFSTRFKEILAQVHIAQVNRLFFYHEWIIPEDRARIAALRQDYLLNGVGFDEQYRLLVDQHALLWIRETTKALLDHQNPGGTQQPVRYVGSISDVTAVNLIQEQLRESETFHRGLIETSNNFIWCVNPEGVLTYVNERAAYEFYRYHAQEMIGMQLHELLAPEANTADALSKFDHMFRGEVVRDLEMTHQNKFGRRVYMSINAVPLFDQNGRCTGAMGINTDITRSKKRERMFHEAVRLQRLIFDSAGEGIVLTLSGRVHRANQAFADLVGSTLGDIVARPLARWFEDQLEWEAVEIQLAKHGQVIKVEQQLMRFDGHALWVSVTGRSASLSEEEQGYIWVFADISARKEREEKSWHRANHDELTGLPNRRLLQDRLEQAFVHAKRESHGMGVLMLDLDGFKAINDHYGHKAGDDLLKQIAQRLLQNIRQLDTAARLGGDEFIVVLYHTESLADVENMALRLIQEIREPVEIDGVHHQVGASIGISIYPESAHNITGLMHSADMAMYAAKAAGKNTYRIAHIADQAG